MDFPFLLHIRDKRTGKEFRCFNPCSYGFSVLTLYLVRRCLVSDTCFNPCSYGFSVLTANCEAPRGRKPHCFNPCSYGFSVLTLEWKAIADEFCYEFQSLFLWIFRSYSENPLYFVN